MRKVFEWFSSWYTTLKIKFKHPELHWYLCDYLDGPDDDWDDFVEVDRPTPKLDALMAEEPSVRAHPRYRTWEEYKAELLRESADEDDK